MSRNGQRDGKNYHSKLGDFEAFDRCPPDVREALREAAFNWSAPWAYNQCKKLPSYAVVGMIKAGDRSHEAKADQRLEATALLAELGL